jgi:ubiquinone/menaquinone biosynthesis C-methylase UbiE
MHDHDSNYPDVLLQRRILHELGHTIGPHSTILDFGCGDGERVFDLRKLGFNTFGVDITLTQESEFLRLIPTEKGYRIPFDDAAFDFVYSNQVFEHVQDHGAALSEIWRVLKPGGISLHYFPPKYKPLEPHTFVPLAGALQGRVWLTIWAWAGVRNRFQAGLKAKDVVKRNYQFLQANTCYLTTNQLRKVVLSRFGNITFAESYFIKHSPGRSRHLYLLVKAFPWLSSVFSATHERVVFFRKVPNDTAHSFSDQQTSR